ncbi:MAG: hypothetical protein AAGI25_20460 [Bacteroidota bacterium]
MARAHGERFNGIDLANTLVEARLVGDGYLGPAEKRFFNSKNTFMWSKDTV